MTSTERSLVLGVLTTLPASSAEPFVWSLRASGFRGQVHLFVGNMGPGEVRNLEHLADRVHVVDDRYPRPPWLMAALLRRLRRQRGLRRFYPTAFRLAVRSGLRRDDRWRALEYHLEGLQTLRYELYAEYLRGLGADADYVLLSDVRDVWFQGDPFDSPPEGLEVFLEDSTVRIATESFNRRWIEDLYGTQIAESLGGHVVSCSGTTAGTRADVLRYAETMATALEGHRRPMSSHDQGVHNVLLRRGALDPVTVVSNTSGRVLTMSMSMTPHVRDGAVTSQNGAVVPVVHQYDRHPEVLQLFHQQIGRFDTGGPSA